MRRKRIHHAWRGGAILLEVVLALAIFAAAAGVIMGAVSSSYRALNRMKLENQAADLAATVMSEVQMGVIDAVAAGPNEFEDASLANWRWQVEVTEPDIAVGATTLGLKQVEVIITNSEQNYTRRVSQWIIDPELAANLPTQTTDDTPAIATPVPATPTTPSGNGGRGGGQ